MSEPLPTLAVIDMQRIFARTDSGWCAPGFDAIVPRVAELVELAGSHAMFTRFVAPDLPTGAWIDYYLRWPFALQPSDSADYRLVEALRVAGSTVIDATTFGKWTPEVAAAVPRRGRLVLCGVSTDCCVLSTAVAAADSGVAVSVVSDACAGSNDEAHQTALSTMAGFAPLIEVVEAQDVRGWWGGRS